MDDFFVGYDPPMPASLARFTRRASVVAIVGATAAAALLATTGHRLLDGGTFAFGSPELVTGRVIEHPHPAVIEGDRRTGGITLVVAPGKHGAAPLVAGLGGREVRLAGTRIQRHGHDMLELLPGTIAPSPKPSMPQSSIPGAARDDGGATVDPTRDTPGQVLLHGEVVDSKCYLGVMVPGEGHTHRACASLCVRGGIPAALLVRTADGDSRLYLLETPAGEAIGPSLAAWAGRRALVPGVTGRRGDWRTLRTTPATWRAAP
jgi:hypothetical protein